ncbi:preprotein translocase subunit SecE [Frisingicoccus sp.]|uniref:preprotein translocase subunit SecE n=1 Tax=Frisingicoccus sp. TaxID=1918627 RepID=UPI00386D5146
MSDMEKAKKPGKLSQIKAEFKKIIWPDRTTVRKETTAVVTVSVLLGLLIALLDIVLRYGVDFLISL